MEVYAGILLWAIPGFFVLVLIEIAFGYYSGKQTYTFMDTLSSLSSGMTNVIKDVLGLAVVLISYPWVLDHIALGAIEDSTTTYIVAFICIDFASYWIHRLNHKVNVFWNQHVIHHSSEEFNLACALRQSISNLIGFGGLFLIPAALIGVPAKVIMTLAPLHLFAQFWYHTQHIGKMGILEYILVTPSQHRVHHAINPLYIDKNLAAVFCIWDRLFGTFQEELDSDPPVYGTLKPAKSWNPIWINFQHFFLLLRDAWYTQKWTDKLRLWLMPTGWRPSDVAQRFPVSIRNLDAPLKYHPHYSSKWKTIALFHFVSLVGFLLFLLATFSETNSAIQSALGLLLFLSIFGYTSLLDFHVWSPKFEIARGIIGIFYFSSPLSALLQVNYSYFTVLSLLYFILTLGIGVWAQRLGIERQYALSNG